MPAAPKQQPHAEGAPAPVCSDQIEDWLTARGVKFAACKSVPIDQIDEERSRGNQARAEAILSETVDRYAQAMRNGDQFPPLVVYRYGKRLTIVDGNHRQAAARRAGQKHVSVYEIDKSTPVEMIELLTAEANTKHGEPTSKEWRMRQAVYLLSLGNPEDLVAHALGLSASAVKESIRLARFEDRAHRLGVKGWDDLSITAQLRLGSLPNDVVLQQAVLLVQEGLVTTADLNVLMRDLRGTGTEKEALEYLGSLREEREFERQQRAHAKEARRSIANPKMQVLSALGAVKKIDPQSVLRLFIGDEERKEVAKRCGDASLILMELEDVLQRGLEDVDA